MPNVSFLKQFLKQYHFTAATKGNLEMTQLFMNKLLDKNPKGGRFGGTPLHFAADEGHINVMNCILDVVEDKNPSDNNGLTPLHSLIKHGYSDTFKLIHETCEEKNPSDRCGESLLHVAASSGEFDIFRMIIDQGIKDLNFLRF